MTIDIGTLDEMIGYQLRRAYQHYYQGFNKISLGQGITASHMGVLSVVRRNAGHTQNEVADALGHDRTFMVSVIDKLLSKGYLERMESLTDRRSYELYITEKGREFLDQALNEANEYDGGFKEKLTAEESKLLLQMLKKIYG